MTSRLSLAAATLAALLCLNTWPATAATAQERTKSLIAVLNSDAPLFEKARACQQLGEVGTAEAVPALARLLADPGLSAYARSGLEGIPDPSAAAALRNAAQTLHGPLLAGVVNSLGALRDDQAVEVLARLAADQASGVGKEALLALGNISNSESIRLLEQMLTGGPAATRAEAASACLLAADRQRTSGNLSRALALYELLRQPNIPLTIRVGATRGAILARSTDRVPFLITQLKSDELAIRNSALLTIREIPNSALATALNTVVPQAAPELQGQLLLAMADCHNHESVSVVQKLSGSSNTEIRQTALAVLGRLGPGAVPALLQALQQERPAEERAVILGGLRAMQGVEANPHLVHALASADTPAVRVELIRLLESRGVTSAAPEFLKQASAPEPNVAIAALSALSSLGSDNELGALIDITKSSTDDTVRGSAESALAGICTRAGQPACKTVLGELTRAGKPSERNSWVRVLTQAACAEALPAIQDAATDRDPEVADNALTQLGHWPTPAPMEVLLQAVDSTGIPRLQKAARTSVLQLAATAIDGAQASDAQIFAWLARVHGAENSIEENRRILGLLGRLKTVESFRLIEPYLENPELRTEAAAALVQIAPALAKTESAGALKTALEKIAETVPNDDLRRRAAQITKSIPAPKPEISLFDGRTLAGWEGSTNVWRVRDSAIVGGSLNGNPQNEFLVTLRPYTNFVLRLEYKLVGTEGFVNGGVQFRSARVANPPNEMKGYQADIGAGYSGSLYDESRRNTFLAQADKAAVQRLEKPNDWNTYEVRCEGNRIQLVLNGERTVDYTEGVADIPQQGLIGLQIHGGCKAEISFRNLRLQEL